MMLAFLCTTARAFGYLEVTDSYTLSASDCIHKSYSHYTPRYATRYASKESSIMRQPMHPKFTWYFQKVYSSFETILASSLSGKANHHVGTTQDRSRMAPEGVNEVSVLQVPQIRDARVDEEAQPAPQVLAEHGHAI